MIYTNNSLFGPHILDVCEIAIYDSSMYERSIGQLNQNSENGEPKINSLLMPYLIIIYEHAKQQ